jgi:hypothetical protein
LSYAKFQGKKELNSQYEKTNSEGNDDKKPFVMNYENYINNIEVPNVINDLFRNTWRSLKSFILNLYIRLYPKVLIFLLTLFLKEIMDIIK